VVKGLIPLVVSSGANGADAAVALSREAEHHGASALMVLPPFYLKTDADGLMHYFDAISRAVSIPIMVQDAPLMTQVPMPAALLARMAKEIERVVYAKVEAPPTAPKVSAVIRAGGPFGDGSGGLRSRIAMRRSWVSLPRNAMVPVIIS